MKRETQEKLKFKHLKRDLNLPQYAAVGILQTLWGVTAINAPRGDIGRFSNEDIAVMLEWEGDPDTLVNALVHRQWIDPHPDPNVRLTIHDWPEHCEDSVHRQLARSRQYFADGTEPRTNRLGKEKAEIDDFYARNRELDENVRTFPGTSQESAHETANLPDTCAPTVTVTVKPIPLPLPSAREERNGTGVRKRNGTERNGKAQSVGDILGKGGAISVNRILAASHDPPEAAAYWNETCRRMDAAGEIETLREAIYRVENEKGFDRPAAFLNRQCSDALKRHGKRMPKPWNKTNQETKA